MKDLLQTHTVSYAQSLRLAYMSFAGRVRVSVVHDEDYDRAMEVVRRFEKSRGSGAVPASWRWQRPGVWAGGVGFVLLMVSGAVAEDLTPPLRYVLHATAVGLLATGIALVLVGLRR